MMDDLTVRFYMEEPLRESAAMGAHNFIGLVQRVLEDAQFRVEYHPLSAAKDGFSGYSLSHMVNPPNSRGLVFRRVYHYPFWQIDALAQRWHWDVARASFDPETADSDAPRFYRFWQKRLFGNAPQATRRDGFAYVPLQGQLQRQRLFQKCTPLEMIEHTLRHANMDVVATLHPKENYSSMELAALEVLERQYSHLTVTRGDMVAYLQSCEFVVTQNSAVAFSGFFFGKPALLFGQIDFHHIAVQADLDALSDSFDRVAKTAPPYDKYVWWFWQEQSINAGRDDAQAKIADRLRHFDWPI